VGGHTTQTHRDEGEASERIDLQINHRHGVKEYQGGLVRESECPVIYESVILIARKDEFERLCCTFGYNPIESADAIKGWRTPD
jgi:hypothetical protein